MRKIGAINMSNSNWCCTISLSIYHTSGAVKRRNALEFGLQLVAILLILKLDSILDKCDFWQLVKSGECERERM